MEIKTKESIKENGAYVKKTYRTKTSKDGFVSNSEMYPNSIIDKMNGEEKFHKGYGISMSYETNDPRITRPVSIIFAGIFIIAGIVVFLNSEDFVSKFFGAYISIFTAVALIGTQKRINEIAKELKQKKKVEKEENKE